MLLASGWVSRHDLLSLCVAFESLCVEFNFDSSEESRWGIHTRTAKCPVSKWFSGRLFSFFPDCCAKGQISELSTIAVLDSSLIWNAIGQLWRIGIEWGTEHSTCPPWWIDYCVQIGTVMGDLAIHMSRRCVFCCSLCHRVTVEDWWWDTHVTSFYSSWMLDCGSQRIMSKQLIFNKTLSNTPCVWLQ